MDSVIRVETGRDYDPNKPTLGEAVDRIEEEAELSRAEKLLALAGRTGDFSEAIDAADLARIGLDAVDDYERDKLARKDWEDVVREALDSASQVSNGTIKNYPWEGAANTKFPILTTAALQFNARMYPAVVKGDEAVLCKVIGQDNGRPAMRMGPNGPEPVMQPGPDGQPAPAWIVPPGAKARRARRVGEYLNTLLFYRVEDWESDTDSLLMQLPIVGCVFRKLWYDQDSGQHRAAMVPALRIFVPEGARSVETTPRLTEELPDVYPHEISERVRSGHYRDIDLFEGKDKESDGARLLLEQHRLLDLDEDGLEEPYIVTIDHRTRKVLRIEANFGPEDIVPNEAGEVVSINRGRFYIKYDLFPHPEGKFYGIGLGHLLKPLGDVINTAVNQLIDAGHAQTAGGGFIASGVRLQARGGSTISFRPGEYKTVDVPGSALREAIVERTLPNASPVTFQVLDLILGAARDISGAKDVITGEASNNGQVGTTLALIEQGLQVFNATAKRTFRSLKDEYTLLKENVRKYGGPAAARDYAEVLDDPEADFEADFNTADMDIRPVSDPSSVTRMQKMARAQFVLGTMEALTAVGGDAREALRRVYEAADTEDIDKLLPPPRPQQAPPPDPRIEAKVMRDLSEAGLVKIKSQREGFELERDAALAGMQLGAVG